MAVKFAKRMERMQASEIRELLKLTAQPDIISFAGGLPAPELFPIEDIAKVSHDLVLKEGRQLLQYATTEGRPTLRAKIAKRMQEKYHTPAKAEDILITTGSQQCLDFAGKLFLDPGDVVLCESPSYLGAINAFNAYEPCLRKCLPIRTASSRKNWIRSWLPRPAANLFMLFLNSRILPVSAGLLNAVRNLWKSSINTSCRYWKMILTENSVTTANVSDLKVHGYQGPGYVPGHLLQDFLPRPAFRLDCRQA
jgi:hypothetical protein